MKIFKKRHVFVIFLGIIIIAVLIGIFAFFVRENLIQRWMLWATFIFGLGSFSLSLLALWISIQTFVKTNKQEKEKIENEAEQFITDNNDEIDFIPLCIIADSFDRHRKYKRKIFVNFNKLNSTLKKEVLNQLNYDCGLISKNTWLKEAKQKLDEFINEFELGDNFLFDYYECSKDYCEELYDVANEDLPIMSSRHFGFPKLKIINGEPCDVGLTFREYTTRYVNEKYNNGIFNNLAPKPLDELIARAELDVSNKKQVCFWAISAIDSLAKLLMEHPKLINKEELFPNVHAKIETFEDRFLLSLSVLFNLSKFVERNK